MANRFYRRQPYDIGLYTPPIEAIQQTLAMAQRNYDTNYALAESIKNNFIPSLPQDRAEANRIQSEWNNKIDEVVSAYNGDYSRAGKQLSSLLSEIRRQYGPGGKAGAIMGNYSNYQQWLGEHQKRIAEGKVLAEDLNYANQYYMKNYTGVGEMDPVTGSYNNFNPEYLSDYQDPNKIIQDVYKEFKPEKKSVGVTTLKNGIFQYEKREVEGIDPNRLFPSFATALASDPKFATYATQAAKFRGQSPEDVQKYVQAFSQQRANDLGYMNESSDSKWERDPLAVAHEKARLDKQNMLDLMGSMLQYSPSTPTSFQLEPTIDHTNWRGSFDDSEHPFYPGEGTLPSQYPGVANYGKNLASKQTTLDSFLADSANNAKLSSKNVIPDLARSMWERQKAYLGEEFKRKYNKDPKYTAQVEKDFWYNYKNEAKNQTAYKSYVFDIPDQAKQNALHLLPDAISGNAAIYIPGQYGQVTKLPDDIVKSLTTKDGKLATDLISVKYAVPSAGYEAAGFEVSTPKGKFVIVDPNYQRSLHSAQMASALNPIFQEGKSQGAGTITYEDLGVDAQGYRTLAQGVPHIKWEYNPSTSSWDQNIYMHERNGDPILDAKGKPVRKSMPEIMDVNIPDFANSLGFGQTKSAITPFQYFLMSQQQ